MSDKFLEQFRRQEAETIALSVQFNRWSRVMIALMIQEQEQKLVASDLPVEAENGDSFWTELS